MKEKKITKILGSAAMAAMMVSPTMAMAAENTSTLDNPAGGAPILTEHPQTAVQTAGQNTTYGSGAKQAVGAAKENVVMGTDAGVKVHSGTQDASFDTAVGHEAGVTGSAGTAIGAAAKVDALFGGTAVGTAASAKGGQMGTAVGHMAEATGNFATAEGANAVAQAKATALGANAEATGDNSVALGQGSVAKEANTVSVGKEGATRRITNVTAGVNGTDGVNVSQLKDAMANATDKNAVHYTDNSHKNVKLDGNGGTVVDGVANGKVSKDSKEAVNGSQLYEVDQKKADVNLSNITKEGEQVIKNLAQTKVDIKSGDGSIVVKKEVKDGQSNFDIKLAEDQTFNKVTVNNIDAKTVKAGDLTVDGSSTFNGDVTFNKEVNFKNNVDAKSFSVNGEKYVTEWGLDANNHKIINVADGTVAAGSKDAVNGGQLYTAMNDVRKGVKDDIDKATGEVGAQAAAMASLHPLEYDRANKVSVAASVGGYKDEIAGAVGAFYRPDNRTILSVQGAFGANDNMWGVGYGQKFGHSHNGEIKDTSDVENALADLQNKYDKLLGMLSNQSGLPARVVGDVVVPEGDMTAKAMSMLKAHDDALDALHNNCNPNPNPNVRHAGFRHAGPGPMTSAFGAGFDEAAGSGEDGVVAE